MNNVPHSGVPGLLQPGQHIVRQEGRETAWSPLQKALILYLVRLTSFAALCWLALVVGPFAAGLLLVVITTGWTAMRLAVYEDTEVYTLLLLVFALGLAAWWCAVGWQAAPWPDLLGWRPDFAPWHIRLLLAAPAIVWLGVQHHPDFRYQNEVDDPSWPPPIGRRHAAYGPARPGVEYDTWPEEPTEPEVVVEYRDRDVSRPIPVHRPGSNGRPLRGPNGETINHRDVLAYVIQAPRLGTTWQGTWKPRGWSHERWRGVVSLLASLGLTTEIQERRAVELLYSDSDEAWAVLRGLF